MKSLSLMLCLIAICAGIATAQSSMTLPAGLLTTGGGAGSGFPFNATTDHRWQWHYANSNFAAAGVTGPITITDISVRFLSPTFAGAGFDFPSVDVYIGSATTAYGVATHSSVFAENTCGDLTLMRSGPWVSGAVGPAPVGNAAADWMSFGSTGSFTYDPGLGRDIIVEIAKCGTNITWGTSIDGSSAAAGLNGGNRYGNTVDCSAATSTFANNEFVPVVKIDYIAGGTPGLCISNTQSNQTESSLTVNGGASAALSNGVAATVDMNSSNAGAPWDVGLVPGASSIGLSAGGIATPAGQTVNLDLTNPSFLWLNNNFSAGGGFPAGGISLPYASANYSVSGQMAVISATYSDGVALSQACDLSWVGCSGSNFDNLPAGGSPPGWTNPSTPWVALASVAWSVDSSGTPSGGTGPTSAASGANYMYCETSGTGGTAEFNMATCPFSTPANTLSFSLSRIGATIGTLNIYVAFNGNWNATPIATYTGADPGQLQGGTEWSSESITVSAMPLGTADIAFSFSYTGGGGFTGDIAIDDVAVN